MAMYGIAVLPLIERVKIERLMQRWYADDRSVAGKLEDLRHVFDSVMKRGKHFGYIVKPSKYHLIVKEASLSRATTIFHGTSINLKDGSRVLGSVIGSERFSKHETEDSKHEIVSTSYDITTERLILSDKSCPRKIVFHVQNDTKCLAKLSERSQIVIPAIVGQPTISDEDRALFSLPLKMGGLNIRKRTGRSEHYFWSRNNVEHLEDENISKATQKQ